MKARLLYRDRDFDWRWGLQAAAEREARRTGRRYHRSEHFDPRSGLAWNAEALMADLALNTLFTAMAGEDDYVFEVARKVILAGEKIDIDTIRYRQDVLKDCLDQRAVVRELYALAVEAMREDTKHYLGPFMTHHPDWVLRWSIELLEGLLASVRKLRKLADSNAGKFTAEAWTRLFATVRDELSEEYIAVLEHHLKQLRFRNGVVLSAGLGKGNKGADYLLHLPPTPGGTWLGRLARAWLPWLFEQQPPLYGFSLHPRDENGFRALAELKDRGIGIAANALGQAAAHVRDFFAMLRTELAFYVGCANLQERLARKGEPYCLPVPAPADEHKLSFRGLYDVCLTLNMDGRVVGNGADADGKDIIIVTGANQGGKSTFLRSVGLAQVMMQCGMFAPAGAFCSSICDSLFTHYKREEDPGMKSGKLDEELRRMSAIVDRMTAHPMILFNESFAATNEREGSEVTRQIVSALAERRVRMLFVTHLYEFARGVYETSSENALFLRADREADGTRTFRLVEGEPLQTSFGEDLYKNIFSAGTTRVPPEEPAAEPPAARRAAR
jgi:hypothetical protein